MTSASSVFNELEDIQRHLMDLMSIIATPPPLIASNNETGCSQRRDWTALRELHSLYDFESRTEWLENLIDAYEKALPLQLHFILPGGSIPAAQLHVCRTVCRRAERTILRTWLNPAPASASGDKDSDSDEDADAKLQRDLRRSTCKYINRLSDYLFVAARWSSEREVARSAEEMFF